MVITMGNVLVRPCEVFIMGLGCGGCFGLVLAAPRGILGACRGYGEIGHWYK